MTALLVRILNVEIPGVIDPGMVGLLGLVISLFAVVVAGIASLEIPQRVAGWLDQQSSTELQEVYQRILAPLQPWILWLAVLVSLDSLLLILPKPPWIRMLEIPIGLVIAVGISGLGAAISRVLFDQYLPETALEDRSKISTELLLLAKYLSIVTTILIVIFIFAQTHQVNLIGLIASLGIGGVAVAFASQKILEQILWSVVLYIDRPFNVDDYIHLPEGTLGRVESLGWRSTKIRLSGKNTLVVAPNSHLAQINIENLTRARRVLLIVDLTVLTLISDEEKSLIHQLILECTSTIVGIEHQFTQVSFQQLEDVNHIKAQIIFFLLGSAETSMEFRRTLLSLARASIVDRLQEYGLIFEFEQKIVDVTQPMTM